MTEAMVSRPETGLNPQVLIQQAIETGDIGTIERMVALAKEMKADRAREAWYAAMSEFQAKCPPIFKTKRAQMRSYGYKWAPLGEILATIQPALGAVGLSVFWETKEVTEKTVSVVCLVAHEAGYVRESGMFTIPIVLAQDDKGASPQQRVGSALSYAQRYSLQAALGIAPEDEDDDGAGPAEPSRPEPEDPAALRQGGPDPDAVITEGQVRMLSAVATHHHWSEDQLHTLLSGYQLESRKQIKRRDFDAIVTRIKQGPPK